MSLIETSLSQTGILSITLNRPDKLNTLTADLLNALEHCFCQAKSNDDVNALLLTGSGKAFCAGADIKALAELTAHSGYSFARRGQSVFRQLEMLGKPSLAVVNGYAFGGGCELAMAASLRMASHTAQFAQPEGKLGAIPGYGGTQRLARLVGKGRALELCLTGRSLSAEEALQWGLINRVTTPDELLSSAEHWLLDILKLAPSSLAGILNTIHTAYDLPLDAALDHEALTFGHCCAHDNKQEGVNAFLKKRTPKWT